MHCIARVQYNAYMSAPNSPKTKSGANGKFLPKPLLFHLRHPNSKTNEPKFCKILSPKNSFCKTSSALFRHLPETLRAEHQRKMSFPLSRKISLPPNQESKRHFSLVLPSEARQWRNDTSVRFSSMPPRTRSVRISPVLVQNRFEQSRVIQHNYKKLPTWVVFSILNHLFYYRRESCLFARSCVFLYKSCFCSFI